VRATGRVLRGSILAVDRRGLVLDVTYAERAWHFASPLVGRHNGYNLLAAMGLGVGLGLPDEAIRSLEGFRGVPGACSASRTAGAWTSSWTTPTLPTRWKTCFRPCAHWISSA
jgi:UDP-N-acetylmuramyl pentapeptide synthase